MNLFHTPTLTELSKLLRNFGTYKNYFHIMVEYDGEVLIERNSEKTKIQLSKYKFHIDGLRGEACVGDEGSNNLEFLGQLYKILIYCWERELTGAIDFNKISYLLNVNYWLEMNSIAHHEEIENSLIPALFKKDSRFPPHTIHL